jgi:alkylation response protein AidB-like acyl-CoA dehydrogenase
VAIDLTLDDDQLELERSVRNFLTARCPRSLVRRVEAGPLGYDPDVWAEMAALGWLAIALPPEYGGAGGRFVDLYPLFEELGRFLTPSPHLESVFAADVILAHGSPDQKSGFLPRLGTGELVVSPALLETSGLFGPNGITMSATVAGADYHLTGTKLLVPFAGSADWLLCVARTTGDLDGRGVTLFLVDMASAGISVAPLPNIAGGALFAVEFDHVVVPDGRVVGTVGRGWDCLFPSLLRAATLQTICVIGAAKSVLEMTNQYAKDREQFGRPIGAYQAVQYMVTDILFAIHNAELLAKQAACRIDSSGPFVREACMAVAYGKRAAAHLHRQAHEVHAGVGFVLDHDLNLFSRRAKYWEYNLGDARYYLEQLAVALNL